MTEKINHIRVPKNGGGMEPWCVQMGKPGVKNMPSRRYEPPGFCDGCVAVSRRADAVMKAQRALGDKAPCRLRQ
jgi:hypothetical protein